MSRDLSNWNDAHIDFFERDSTGWQHVFRHTEAAGGHYGLVLHIDRDVAVVSRRNQFVQVFERDQGQWSLSEVLTDPTGNNEEYFGAQSRVVGDTIAVTSSMQGNWIVRLYRKQGGSWVPFQTLNMPSGLFEFGCFLESHGDRLAVSCQPTSFDDAELFLYQVPVGGLAQLEGRRTLQGCYPIPYFFTGFAFGERNGRYWVAWNDLQGQLWSSRLDAIQAPRFLQAEDAVLVLPATDGVLIAPPNPASNTAGVPRDWQYMRVQPFASPGIAGSSFSTLGVPVASGSSVVSVATGEFGAPSMLSLAMGTSVCVGDLNSTGQRGALLALGCATVSSSSLSLGLTQMPASANGILVESLAPFSPLPGTGALCVSPPFSRLAAFTTDATGQASLSMAQLGGFSVGQTRTFLGWYRDGLAARRTNALGVTLTP